MNLDINTLTFRAPNNHFFNGANTNTIPYHYQQQQQQQQQ